MVRNKKVLCMSLMVLLCIAFAISGCSNSKTDGQVGNQDQVNGGNETNDNSDDADQADRAYLVSKTPVTLTMATSSNPLWPYNKNWLVYDVIRELTNVTIEPEIPAGADYASGVNLIISSGELPDIIYTSGISTANKYGSDGAFVNLLDHMDELPNLQAFFEERPRVKESLLSVDGKIFLFPNAGLADQLKRVWAYREDVFLKHDLSAPTTFDELYETMLKLKELYPDSYPLGLFDGINSIRPLAPSFDVYASQYYDEAKNEWGYGPIEDNFKKYIEYLHKFYQDKLIPPDFLSLTRPNLRDMFLQDKSFISIDGIGTIDELPFVAVEDNPEFVLRYMAPPAGREGGPQKTLFNSLQSTGYGIASTSKNKELAMKYMDFFFTPKGSEITSWGKEGVTFEIVDGKKHFLPKFTNYTDLRKDYGLLTVGSYVVYDPEAYVDLASPMMQEALTVSKDYELHSPPSPAFNTDEQEIISTLGSSITKHFEENISKFIVGQRDLSEWPKYVDEVKQLGLDKFLGAYKTAYDRVLQVK